MNNMTPLTLRYRPTHNSDSVEIDLYNSLITVLHFSRFKEWHLGCHDDGHDLLNISFGLQSAISFWVRPTLFLVDSWPLFIWKFIFTGLWLALPSALIRI